MGFTAADTALPDSAVGARLSQYFDGLVSGSVRMWPLPFALGTVLRERGDYRVDDVGVSRAFELAQAQRTKADSAAGSRSGTGMQRAPGGPPVPAPTPAAPDSADGDGVDHGVHEGRRPQIGKQPPATDHQCSPHRKIDNAYPEEEQGTRGADRSGGAEVPIEGVQRRRNKQSIEVDQPDDAPGQIGGCERSVGNERHRPRL
jgi:hypothetical protein